MSGLRALIAAAAALVGACAYAGAEINIENKELRPVSLRRAADDVWLHQSYEEIAPWGPILSQGLVVETGEGLIIVDTAWTNAQTKALLAQLETAFEKPVIAVIVTHAHNDKMGGMAAVIEAGAPTFAIAATNEDAPVRGLVPARRRLVIETDEDGAGRAHSPFLPAPARALVIYYPGPGHTRDNIVIYHPASKTLFGGCLIRPGDARGLGNTEDADIEQWAATVTRVAAVFPAAEIIVPSHGAAGGRELLQHTIDLAEQARVAPPRND